VPASKIFVPHLKIVSLIRKHDELVKHHGILVV